MEHDCNTPDNKNTIELMDKVHSPHNDYSRSVCRNAGLELSNVNTDPTVAFPPTLQDETYNESAKVLVNPNNVKLTFDQSKVEPNVEPLSNKIGEHEQLENSSGQASSKFKGVDTIGEDGIKRHRDTYTAIPSRGVEAGICSEKSEPMSSETEECSNSALFLHDDKVLLECRQTTAGISGILADVENGNSSIVSEADKGEANCDVDQLAAACQDCRDGAVQKPSEEKVAEDLSHITMPQQYNVTNAERDTERTAQPSLQMHIKVDNCHEALDPTSTRYLNTGCTKLSVACIGADINDVNDTLLHVSCKDKESENVVTCRDAKVRELEKKEAMLCPNKCVDTDNDSISCMGQDLEVLNKTESMYLRKTCSENCTGTSPINVEELNAECFKGKTELIGLASQHSRVTEMCVNMQQTSCLELEDEQFHNTSESVLVAEMKESCDKSELLEGSSNRSEVNLNVQFEVRSGTETEGCVQKSDAFLYTEVKDASLPKQVIAEKGDTNTDSTLNNQTKEKSDQSPKSANHLGTETDKLSSVLFTKGIRSLPCTKVEEGEVCDLAKFQMQGEDSEGTQMEGEQLSHTNEAISNSEGAGKIYKKRCSALITNVATEELEACAENEAHKHEQPDKDVDLRCFTEVEKLQSEPRNELMVHNKMDIENCRLITKTETTSTDKMEEVESYAKNYPQLHKEVELEHCEEGAELQSYTELDGLKSACSNEAPAVEEMAAGTCNLNAKVIATLNTSMFCPTEVQTRSLLHEPGEMRRPETTAGLSSCIKNEQQLDDRNDLNFRNMKLEPVERGTNSQPTLSSKKKKRKRNIKIDPVVRMASQTGVNNCENDIGLTSCTEMEENKGHLTDSTLLVQMETSTCDKPEMIIGTREVTKKSVNGTEPNSIVVTKLETGNSMELAISVKAAVTKLTDSAQESPTHIPMEIETCSLNSIAETNTSRCSDNIQSISNTDMEAAQYSRNSHVIPYEQVEECNKLQAKTRSTLNCEAVSDANNRIIKSMTGNLMQTEHTNEVQLATEKCSVDRQTISTMDIEVSTCNESTPSVPFCKMRMGHCNETDSITHSELPVKTCSDHTIRISTEKKTEIPLEAIPANIDVIVLGQNSDGKVDNKPDLKGTKQYNEDEIATHTSVESIKPNDSVKLNTQFTTGVEESWHKTEFPVQSEMQAESNRNTKSMYGTAPEVDTFNNAASVSGTQTEGKNCNVRAKRIDIDNDEEILNDNIKVINTSETDNQKCKYYVDSTKGEKLIGISKEDTEAKLLNEEKYKRREENFKLIQPPLTEYTQYDSIRLKKGMVTMINGDTESDIAALAVGAKHTDNFNLLMEKSGDDPEEGVRVLQNVKTFGHFEHTMCIDRGIVNISENVESIASTSLITATHMELRTQESNGQQSVCPMQTETTKINDNNERIISVHSETNRHADSSELMRYVEMEVLEKGDSNSGLPNTIEMAVENGTIQTRDKNVNNNTEVICSQTKEDKVRNNATSTDDVAIENNHIEFCSHSQQASEATDTEPMFSSQKTPTGYQKNTESTVHFNTEEENNKDGSDCLCAVEMGTENHNQKREIISSVFPNVNNQDLVTRPEITLSNPYHCTESSTDIKMTPNESTDISNSNHVEAEVKRCNTSEIPRLYLTKFQDCNDGIVSVVPTCNAVECSNGKSESNSAIGMDIKGGNSNGALVYSIQIETPKCDNDKASLIDTIVEKCEGEDVPATGKVKNSVTQDSGESWISTVHSAEEIVNSGYVPCTVAVTGMDTNGTKPIFSTTVGVDKINEGEFNVYPEVTIQDSNMNALTSPPVEIVNCNNAVSQPDTETKHDHDESVVTNAQVETEYENCNKTVNSLPIVEIEPGNDDGLVSISIEQINIEDCGGECSNDTQPAIGMKQEDMQPPEDSNSVLWIENTGRDDEDSTCSAIITNVRSISEDAMSIEIEENTNDSECQVVHSIKRESFENDSIDSAEVNITEPAASDEMQILGTHYQLIPAQSNLSSSNSTPAYSRVNGGDYYSLSYGGSNDNHGISCMGNQPFDYSKPLHHQSLPSAPFRRPRSHSQGKMHPSADRKPYGYTLVPHAYNTISVPRPKRLCSISEYLKIVKRLDGRLFSSQPPQNTSKQQEPFPVALIKANSDYSTGYMFVRPSGSEYNHKRPLPPGCNEEWWTLCHVEDNGTFANIPPSPISQLPPDIGKPATVGLPASNPLASSGANIGPKAPNLAPKYSQRPRTNKRKGGNPTRNTKRVKIIAPVKSEVDDVPPVPQEDAFKDSSTIDTFCSSLKVPELCSITSLNKPKEENSGHSKSLKGSLSGAPPPSREEKNKKRKRNHKIPPTDPENREIARQRNKIHQQKLRQDPYYRQMERERNRLYLQKLRSDPQYRQKERERNRLYREKLRQRRLERGSDSGSQKKSKSNKENVTDSSKESESQ